jgi:phage tail tape-measure protein
LPFVSSPQSVHREIEELAEVVYDVGGKIDAWAKSKRLEELPSDDDADEMREILEQAREMALELRQMLLTAAEHLPTDWR